MYSTCSLFVLILIVLSDLCNGFNIVSSQPRFIDNEELNYDENVYFGYSFAIKSTSPPNPPLVNFLIGSPKARDPSSTEVMHDLGTSKAGNLLTCSFSFDDSSRSCVSSRPPPVNQTVEPNVITSGESLGLEIVSTTNSDRITACAPTRTNNCSSGAIVYGACYISNDFGRSWEGEPRQPEASCPIDHIDLMFVLDGSGSVISDDPMNFDRVKTWVKEVTQKFNLDGFANVGVIQYSHYDETRPLHDQLYLVTEIGLGQYNNQADFQEAVDDIELQGFTTYTAHALNRTVLDFRMSPRFNDSTTRKVLILLTDGRSNDRDFLIQSSNYARSLGITIFAVGVAGYSERELQIIANGQVGNNERVFGLENFSDLQEIVVGLQRSIAGVLEGSLRNSTNELQQSETGLSGAQSELCTSSTALSAGGIRTQFSVPANIKLSQMTAEFLRNLKLEVSTVDHPDPDVGFNPQGYLIMATEDGREQLIKNFNTQTANGAKIMLMTQDQLKETMPWLNVDGIELATYGLKDEGWFDPMLLMDCYKKKNPTLGIQSLKGEVVGFKKERLAGRQDVKEQTLVSKYSGMVELPDDRIVGAYIKVEEYDKPVYIEASNIINCAGADSGKLAELAGIGGKQPDQSSKLNFKLPIERRKRYIYVVHCPDAPLLDCPFIIDPSGAYVRRDGLGGKYICGMSPTTEADEPSTDNLEVDYNWFEDEVWPRIAHRVPAFEKLKLTSAWAGFYDYNTYDQNAVIGSHPYYDNMWFLTGFSGHGVQQSYGAANCLAEQMVHQESEKHGNILDTLSFNRFINNRPAVEFNII